MTEQAVGSSRPLQKPGDLRTWPNGPDRPSLPRIGEVHLWSALLDDLDPPEGATCLDVAERTRAARFAHVRDAIRFRHSRWMYRSVLSRYLGLAPADVRYASSPSGRPELDADGETGLRFNASESGGIALLALTVRTPVGTDVERPGDLVDRLAIARAVFHHDEWKAIAVLGDDAEQTAAFYRCWTRKEAVGKGVGLGLHLKFDRFVVGVDARESPWPVALQPPHGRWMLLDLSTPPAIYGALAVASSIRTLRAWSWRPAAARVSP